MDYKTRIEELETSNNRFAPVILAQLAVLQKQSPQDKLINKLALTKHLYTRGWQKDDILNLYRFIDWLMILPASLEVKYQQAVDEMEEELHVTYVTTAERIGIQKGVQQGETSILLQLLEYKFKNVPDIYSKKIQTANSKTLVEWSKRILDAKKLEDVFAE